MSTNRAQLRAGCKTVLDAVKAANPTLLVHTYDHFPGSFRTPCAYVDNVISEPSILHDASTRRMELFAEVHIVNKYTSYEQAAGEQDALVDLIVDAFTATPRAASSSSLTEPTRLEGHEETDGEATYPCSVLTVRGRFNEGRL